MLTELEATGFVFCIEALQEEGKVGWQFSPLGTQASWDLMQVFADRTGVGLQEMVDRLAREIIAAQCIETGEPLPTHSRHLGEEKEGS